MVLNVSEKLFLPEKIPATTPLPSQLGITYAYHAMGKARNNKKISIGLRRKVMSLLNNELIQTTP